jgi:hypothetical protein
MAESRQLSPTSTLHDDRDQRQHASSSALEKVDLAEKGSAVPYDGAGTAESPYIVKFLDGEQANPQNWTKTKKWQVPSFFVSTCSFSVHRIASPLSCFLTCIPTHRTITANSAISTLCIAFGSSVVSAAIPELTTVFGKDLTVLTLSVSLYVLGFALGPLL